MVKEVYDGTRKPGDISAEDVQRTYDELNKGAGSGWGKGWDEGVIGDSPGNERIRLMKQNIYKFSVAKSHTQLMELNALLYDGDRLKSYAEFKAAADKLGVEYNENWLEAEYRTARQSGHMAAKWESIEANKKLFPNLKYKTQEDNRVRKDHEALNGIIAPIDSPFWDKYFPPNGWGCRCDAVQTAEPASTDIPDTLPEVKPEFEINVGKGGQIYSEDSKTGHRFFALAKKDPNWPKRFELSKLEAGYEYELDKKLKISIYADGKDLKRNIQSARKYVKENMEIVINPHIDSGVIPNHKNPEYIIDNTIADLKCNFNKDNYNGISNCFKEAKEQGCKAIAIDLTYSFSSVDINKVERIINGKVTKERGTWIEFLVISYKENTIKISRQEILEGKLKESIKKLEAKSK